MVNGEFPGIPEKADLMDSTVYAVSYITSSPVEKLYTFTVSPPVLSELKRLASFYRKRFLNEPFHSLHILEELQSLG